MTNARFEDLEKRVKKIKLKNYIKIVFVLAIVLGVVFYVTTINKPKKVLKPISIKKIEKKEIVKKEPKVQKIKPIEKKIKKEIVQVKKENGYDTIMLSPNVDFFKTKKRENITKKITPKEEISKKSEVLLHVNVKKLKSEDTLLKRFKEAKDFDSAMGLAYLYFKKKNFEKSIYWSKKASKLNSSEESSWLIYAKSKKAIGKKDEAIKALRLYLEYFSSSEIKKLLKLYRDK
jgi:tetratricopeptide (TPR) repeat protein